MMDDPKTLVLSGLEGLNHGKLDFYSNLAEDVRYLTPGGVIRGRQATLDADLDLFTQLAWHHRVVERAVVDGSKVAVWLRFSAAVRATGVSFDLDLCVLFTVADGQIHGIEIYGDYAPLFSALNPAASASGQAIGY